MATREPSPAQQRQTQRNQEVDEAAAPEVSEDLKERQDALADDVDSILADIDDVLEENAEDFVRGFVQKGGQ
jgi:prokaryotic ubiquitin-like protein Pup